MSSVILSLVLALAACNLPTPAPVVTAVATAEPPKPTLPPEMPSAAPPTEAVPANWQTYTDQAYGFTFRYPPRGEVTNRQDHAARISLPIAPDTNLIEKFIDVNAAKNVNPCASQNPGASQSQPVTVNGRTFLEERGADAGAGQVYEWLAYSTSHNNVCVSLSFVLHSANPNNYAVPPPLFDKAAEADVFAPILDSFAWPSP
jgi:hypothetical protein